MLFYEIYIYKLLEHLYLNFLQKYETNDLRNCQKVDFH